MLDFSNRGLEALQTPETITLATNSRLFNDLWLTRGASEKIHSLVCEEKKWQCNYITPLLLTPPPPAASPPQELLHLVTLNVIMISDYIVLRGCAVARTIRC